MLLLLLSHFSHGRKTRLDSNRRDSQSRLSSKLIVENFVHKAIYYLPMNELRDVVSYFLTEARTIIAKLIEARGGESSNHEERPRVPHR